MAEDRRRKTGECPQCQKQRVYLANYCPYCGFELEDSDEEDDAET